MNFNFEVEGPDIWQLVTGKDPSSMKKECSHNLIFQTHWSKESVAQNGEKSVTLWEVRVYQLVDPSSPRRWLDISGMYILPVSKLKSMKN